MEEQLILQHVYKTRRAPHKAGRKRTFWARFNAALTVIGSTSGLLPLGLEPPDLVPHDRLSGGLCNYKGPYLTHHSRLESI